jgi:hypothetical protein
VKKNFLDFFPGLDEIPERVAMISRPEVNRFLSVGYTDGSGDKQVDFANTNTTRADFIWTPEDTTFVFDENLHLTNGAKVVASSSPGDGYGYFRSNKLGTGLKWYPGKLITDDDNLKLNYTIHNTDNVSMVITPVILSLTGDPGSPTVTATNCVPKEFAGNSTTSHVLELNNADGQITKADWNALSLNAFGMALALKITNPAQVGRVPSGFSWSLSTSDDTKLYHLDGISWRTWSLFQVLEDKGALRNQYKNADSYVVTAQSTWLENVTAQFFKGGSVAAAQLPGGSEAFLPSTVSQLESFIRRQRNRVLDSNSLATGVWWTYVPEKVQDIFFKPTDPIDVASQDYHPAPYFAAVLGIPQSDQTTPQFVVDLRVMLEYITQEIDAPSYLAPDNINGWLEKYYGELSKHNNVLENPNHSKTIREIARKVVTSPAFRQASKELLAYGMKQLPLLATSLF